MFLARVLLSSACLASLGIAASAQAQQVTGASASDQTAPAGAPAADAASGGLQEIVVTAQKRSENLQNVPISVTAVSSATVENLHAVTIQGLQGTTPNVQINNFSNTPNSAVFSIRGIGVIEPDPYAGFINDPVQGPVQGNTIQNAGKAIIKGFELEATAALTRGLTLTGSLAHLDATYDDFPYLDPLTLAVINLKGEPLQNAPKWTATAGATYALDIGEHKLTANALYSYNSSKFFTNVQNTPRSLIQPTHLVDANLDWALPGGRIVASVWARNLFDNRYLASVYDSPGFIGLANYMPPRRFGVTLRFNNM
jgi:outer membrane receptor protein involved in Fe transport